MQVQNSYATASICKCLMTDQDMRTSFRNITSNKCMNPWHQFRLSDSLHILYCQMCWGLRLGFLLICHIQECNKQTSSSSLFALDIKELAYEAQGGSLGHQSTLAWHLLYLKGLPVLAQQSLHDRQLVSSYAASLICYSDIWFEWHEGIEDGPVVVAMSTAFWRFTAILEIFEEQRWRTPCCKLCWPYAFEGGARARAVATVATVPWDITHRARTDALHVGMRH